MGNRSPSSGWFSKFYRLIGGPIRRILNWKPNQHNLIDPESPRDIGYFIHGTEKLHWKQVRSFLSKRYDILEEVTKLQSFKVTKVPQPDFLDMRLVQILVSGRPRTIILVLERRRPKKQYTQWAVKLRPSFQKKMCNSLKKVSQPNSTLSVIQNNFTLFVNKLRL